MMTLTRTALPATMVVGLYGEVACRASVALSSPCWARILISMPEIRPLTAAGQGGRDEDGVGEGEAEVEDQPSAGLPEMRQGRARRASALSENMMNPMVCCEMGDAQGNWDESRQSGPKYLELLGPIFVMAVEIAECLQLPSGFGHDGSRSGGLSFVQALEKPLPSLDQGKLRMILGRSPHIRCSGNAKAAHCGEPVKV